MAAEFCFRSAKPLYGYASKSLSGKNVSKCAQSVGHGVMVLCFGSGCSPLAKTSYCALVIKTGRGRNFFVPFTLLMSVDGVS